MRRKEEVTLKVILTALMYVILGSAALIGIINLMHSPRDGGVSTEIQQDLSNDQGSLLFFP